MSVSPPSRLPEDDHSSPAAAVIHRVRAHLRRRGIDTICRGGMLDLGADTFWEEYDPEKEPEE